MSLEFDLAQTFFIDKDAVLGADTCFITSVDLYFEGKPVAGKTTTGITKPGCSVHLCPVDNEVPILDQTYQEVARVEYDSIYATGTATTPTNFKFNYPIPVKTNLSYAVLIKFDGSDNDFKLWWNKAGEKVLDTTNTTQVSSGKVDGAFYTITNGKSLTAMNNADLKFNLNIAKFTSLESTFRLQNNNNEFLVFYANSISGNFKGGEYVWQNNAPSTGTVKIETGTTAVIGTGTSFTSALHVGDKFVLTDGTVGNADVRSVTSIANNTYMTIDVAPTFSATSGSYIKTPVATVYDVNGMTERIALEDSTSNTSISFTADAYIHGVDSLASCKIQSIEDFECNYVRPSYTILTPAGTSTNVSINVANSTYHALLTTEVQAHNGDITFVNGYPAVFGSRTHEVVNGATLFEGAKTFQSKLTFQTVNKYTSPYAKEENLDAFVTRYVVNNDSTNEHLPYGGNASSKYVSKRVVLADGQDAEDLRVYLTAYRPANTDIVVYAKLHNNTDSEPFDDKGWTKLQLVNPGIVSNPYNRNDLIELEYSIPQYQTVTQVDGLFTTTLGSGVITSTNSTTVNTNISVGDLVRVSQPNFPENHIVSIVTAATTTTLTIADPVANASMVASGLTVGKIAEKNSAFINIQNNNVVRYYNSTGAAFDEYKNFAIKVVLLSTTDYRVPYVDNLRSIAVSA